MMIPASQDWNCWSPAVLASERCYHVTTPFLFLQVSDDGGENVTCAGPYPPTEWHHHAEAQWPEAPQPWGETLEPHGQDVHWVNLSLCHGSSHRLQGRCAGPRVEGRGAGWGSGLPGRATLWPTWRPSVQKFFLSGCDRFTN